MSTQTAILWNLDTANEEVIRESIDWDLHFSHGEPESVFKVDKRTRVEPRHYATGGQYRSKLWIAHMNVFISG